MIPSPNAVRWAWRELCLRAGWTDTPPSLDYGRRRHSEVYIQAAAPTRWQALLKADELPEVEGIPHLFPAGKLCVLQGAQLIIFPDLICNAIFQLGRWEEQQSAMRDEHDRFPAHASLAARSGTLERPLLDETARQLQACLKLRFPDWQPSTPDFQIALTHDIDSIRAFPEAKRALRRAGGDLLKRKSPLAALRSLRGGLSPKHDPFITGIRNLAQLSEDHGLSSTFFVQTAEAGPNDEGYDSSELTPLIDSLRKKGHSFGFHPGYSAARELERLADEKARCDALLGEARYPTRLHYLRQQLPDTWRQLAALGLREDWSLGYADLPGFRAGTCHPYTAFDLEADSELDLRLVPLIAMEGTLKQYCELTPDALLDRALALAEQCRAVGGTFTFLWHNSSFIFEWDAYAPVYQSLLKALTEAPE